MNLDLNELQNLHKGGKLSVIPTSPLRSKDDLSKIYTPGVGKIVELIRDDPSKAQEYTIAGKMIAVITNGTAVLGFGDVGPAASLPVMEGKCVIFKELGGIDAFPLAIAEKDTKAVIDTIVRLAPNFAAINLEDIAAPECFRIEQEVQKRVSIPVMHDDQHGTAIVTTAALLNALQVIPKKKVRITIVGAGAAGNAIAKLLLTFADRLDLESLTMVDSKGIVSEDRTDLDTYKQELAALTKQTAGGSLGDALVDRDVFIGVSKAGLLTPDLIKTMRANPFVFAMANPTPEIMPDEAYAAGAAIVGTGRSDFPNQINNALAYPGVFKGMLQAQLTEATTQVKQAAVEALVSYHAQNVTKESLLPDIMDKGVVDALAQAIMHEYQE